MSEEFIDGWRAKARDVTRAGLAYLVGLDGLPVPDGVFGTWVDELCATTLVPDDIPAIIAILDKPDPYLQEAGVELATAAHDRRGADRGRKTIAACAQLEPALARLVARDDLDPWVLESLVDLLAVVQAPFTAVYQGLAKREPTRPWIFPGNMRRIHRNRAIDPWSRLEALCVKLALETLEPTPRDFAYLPILESSLGTRGWDPTIRHALVTSGRDADAHFAMLRRDRHGT